MENLDISVIALKHLLVGIMIIQQENMLALEEKQLKE
jgi:hypothetical protein